MDKEGREGGGGGMEKEWRRKGGRGKERRRNGGRRRKGGMKELSTINSTGSTNCLPCTNLSGLLPCISAGRIVRSSCWQNRRHLYHSAFSPATDNSRLTMGMATMLKMRGLMCEARPPQSRTVALGTKATSEQLNGFYMERASGTLTHALSCLQQTVEPLDPSDNVWSQ
jgi:hypothetical protein